MRIIGILSFIVALLAVAVYLRLPEKPVEQGNHMARVSQVIEREVRAPLSEADALTTGQPAPVPAPEPREMEEIPEDAIAGEVIYRFKDAAAAEDFARRARDAGHQVLWVSRQLNAVHVRLGTGLGFAALDDLAGDDAEREYNYPVFIPSHPSFEGGGGTPFNESPLNWLGFPQDRTWGQGVRIAILDTGVLPHPALSQARIRKIDLLGQPYTGEMVSHGTAVASLIAGAGEYIRGASPEADILDVRVLDPSGRGSTAMLALGIVEAVDAGAKFISMSLGSYYTSPTLQDALAYAYRNGVALIAPTGNDATMRPLYPAAHTDYVYGISGIDKNGNRAAFSNVGNSATIAAPAVGIPVAWGNNQEVLADGTSWAVAYVSSAAAGIYRSRPGTTPQQAVQLLLDYADDAGPPGRDEYFGHGILNVDRALRSNQPGIYDVGVAPFFIQPADLEKDVIPVQVLVENRGTETTSFQLEVEVNGRRQTFTAANVPPNGVNAYEIPVNGDSFRGSGINMTARTIITRGTDARPGNNNQTGVVRLVVEEE